MHLFSKKIFINKKSLIGIISFILALFPTLVTPELLKDELSAFSISNSIFSLLIFFGYFFLIRSALLNFEKRLSVISVITGLLFSMFMVFGRNMYVNGKTEILFLESWRNIIAILPVFYSLVLLIIKYLPELREYRLFSLKTPLQKKEWSAKKSFFVVWIIIFVAWIPSLLASYPGVYGYDSISQVNYYRSGEISLHHPLIHTYLLGFCVVTLGNLLGSYEAGMCCYSVFQMLCLSATFAAIYSCFIKKRASKIVSLAVLLIFMFLPTNPIMAFSATKDVLFAAFFALAFMMLMLLADNPELIKSVKFIVCFGAVLFFMSAFRNQGIYIIIITAIFALILLWKYKKNVFLVFLSAIVLIGVYSGPVSSLLGGVKANSLREMMSIPCVQLSRAMVYSEDELEEESALIKEYIPQYEIYTVNSSISDIMKGCLDTERVKKNPLEFIKLWIKVGIKCPVVYIDAFARITIGYWYPDMNYRDPQAYHPYWEYYPTGVLEKYDENKFLLLKQTPIAFKDLHEKYYKLAYENSYQKTPVISMLFSSALPLWMLIIYIAMCVYYKKYKHFVPISFALGLVLTLLLGPVVLYRYLYPFCIICPILLASAIDFKNKGEV
ncbi:MAG: hypothetical protein E7480_01745 [Ruminococcaceae bacterium]|nr:hypothetical protein [Oscillospiraceae bacterium]